MVQGALCDQIHLAAIQQRRKFRLDPVEREETWDLASLEVDQHVHVAVWTEVRAQNRAEQGQPADVMTPAQRRQARVVDRDNHRHDRAAFYVQAPSAALGSLLLPLANSHLLLDLLQGAE